MGPAAVVDEQAVRLGTTMTGRIRYACLSELNLP